MRYLAGLLLVCGCFSPSPPLHSPCPSGVCPSGLVCSPATMTCEETAVDAPLPDAQEVDAIPDGCYGSFVTVCPDAPITGNTEINVAAPVSLNTTTSPQCLPYHLPDGTPDATYCVVAAKTISIGVLGRLTVTGTRPLVVIATGELDIAGAIDAASHASGAAGPNADPAACVASAAPALDDGGPGGSFGTAGGDGGGTDGGPKVTAAPASGPPATLRGGCPGRDGSGGNNAGTGGRGGGAIYLLAGTLSINGGINASGAGGEGAGLSAGGGGGGSGGMIVLEAASIVAAPAARILANGGGGGGGAGVIRVLPPQSLAGSISPPPS